MTHIQRPDQASNRPSYSHIPVAVFCCRSWQTCSDLTPEKEQEQNRFSRWNTVGRRLVLALYAIFFASSLLDRSLWQISQLRVALYSLVTFVFFLNPVSKSGQTNVLFGIKKTANRETEIDKKSELDTNWNSAHSSIILVVVAEFARNPLSSYDVLYLWCFFHIII